MRTRNVKALANLIEAAAAIPSGGYRLASRGVVGDTRRSIVDDPVRLAEWLVETGSVLVPNAVSEQEAMDLLHQVPEEACVKVREPWQGPLLREGLRRIAADVAPGDHDKGVESILHLKGTHHWGISAPELRPDAAAGLTPDS